jgi:hypothetical protein
MTNTTNRAVRSAGAVDGIPRDLPAAMRAELPSVGDEIISEIRRNIPEYARPMDGPYGHALRLGVAESLKTFVDRVADPSAPSDSRDETCRRLGQFEAQEGRSLDALQAAYRIGCQVAWRRVMKLGLQADLSPATVASLADAIFSYMNELAMLSAEGYREALRQSGTQRQRWRRQLMRLILEQPPVPRQGMTGLAEQASWPLPDTVTPVALRRGAGAPNVPGPVLASGESPAEAGTGISLIDSDILTDLNCPQPALLIPGPATETRRLALAGALDGHRAVIGLTVPLAGAADSLRWARQALALAGSGVIGDAPVIRCEDHLITLWLLSDAKLADQVVQHQMGMLAQLTPHQRAWVTDTLGPWLEKRATAAEIAELLHVHPQTVRYRIKQFEQAFGDRLSDPEARFALELALRVMRLRQRASRQTTHKRRGRSTPPADLPPTRMPRPAAAGSHHDPFGA